MHPSPEPGRILPEGVRGGGGKARDHTPGKDSERRPSRPPPGPSLPGGRSRPFKQLQCRAGRCARVTRASGGLRGHAGRVRACVCFILFGGLLAGKETRCGSLHQNAHLSVAVALPTRLRPPGNSVHLPGSARPVPRPVPRPKAFTGLGLACLAAGASRGKAGRAGSALFPSQTLHLECSTHRSVVGSPPTTWA